MSQLFFALSVDSNNAIHVHIQKGTENEIKKVLWNSNSHSGPGPIISEYT